MSQVPQKEDNVGKVGAGKIAAFCVRECHARGIVPTHVLVQALQYRVYYSLVAICWALARK